MVVVIVVVVVVGGLFEDRGVTIVYRTSVVGESRWGREIVARARSDRGVCTAAVTIFRKRICRIEGQDEAILVLLTWGSWGYCDGEWWTSPGFGG